MSLYARTRGKAILSPAICDRCRLRGNAADMIADPDKDGLFVHKHCADLVDPWKLPPRNTENITIPRPRPDAQITNHGQALTNNPMESGVVTDDGDILSP